MSTDPFDRRQWAWQRLRLLRSSPPGRAARSRERADILVAALEQAEQLMRAAAAIGPAARPLPLFYALSQAGRAIAAAQLRDRFHLSSHGLSWPGSENQSPLFQRLITPEERGSPSFARVAEASGSDALSGPVALGEVWRALPDLAAPALPDPDPAWTPATELILHEPFTGTDHPTLMDWIQFGIYPAPDLRDADELTRSLERYPSLAPCRPVTIASDVVYTLAGRTSSDRFMMPLLRAQATAAHETSWYAALDGIAPPYAGDAFARFAIPRLSTGDTLTPLMLWWVVLFALSNVARYEPRDWFKAIDVNASSAAVPLEACLDQALQVVPHLVLEALVGEPVLVGDFPAS